MTKSWEDIYKEFLEPFPAEMVKWRVGATNDRENPTSGIPLAYIDARAVMERLDKVVGAENWWDEYQETASGRVICKLTIRRGEDFIPKSDGAGSTDMEGEKGGLSDAFKRAAVKWGIGRYLYALGTEWVPVKRRGKSVVLAGSPPTLPAWALPKGSGTVVRMNPNIQQKDESEQEDKKDPKIVMAEKFTELYKQGCEVMGTEKFFKAANMIIENGYGGRGAKDLPIEEARSLYMDIAKAIKNGGA